MSWIHTQMKPKKICNPNSVWPLHEAFRDNKWEESGGTKHCGVLMAAMVAAYDIRAVLEIGLWNGFMTRVLAKALSATAQDSGLLVSCDINPNACERSRKIGLEYPIEHRVVEGDSKKTLLELKENFGLVFIDGDHSYEATKSDMEVSAKLLNRCGLMVVHDYSRNHQHEKVYEAVNEFVRKEGWPCFFLPESRVSVDYRTVILQKKWDYF